MTEIHSAAASVTSVCVCVCVRMSPPIFQWPVAAATRVGFAHSSLQSLSAMFEWNLSFATVADYSSNSTLLLHIGTTDVVTATVNALHCEYVCAGTSI